MRINRYFAQIVGLVAACGLFLPDARAQTFAEQMSAKCPTLIPENNRLDEMCDVIAGKSPEKQGSPYNFKFQRIIYEAAGSDPKNESKEVIGRKVGVLWHIHKKEFLRCPFGLSDASITKLAAKKKFAQFVQACAYWGVGVNDIEEGVRHNHTREGMTYTRQGMTVADFLQDEIELNKGNANERILIYYFEILRRSAYSTTPVYGNSGTLLARYRSEIEAAIKMAGSIYGKENVGSYGHGFVAVSKDRKWGLANEAGKLIVPCEYSEVIIIGKDYFAVRKASPTFFFINRENKTVPGPWDQDKTPTPAKETK